MFNHCYDSSNGGIRRIEWPDGKCYFDQDNLTVIVLDTIYSEIVEMNKND